MKKRLIPIFIVIVFLLAFSTLFSGCEDAIFADNSDKNEETSALSPPSDSSISPPFSDEAEEREEQEDPIKNAGSTPSDQSTPPPPEEKSRQTDRYIAACASANVNVRSGAGTEHPVLFTLKQGDSLPFLGRVGDWLCVQTDGGVGYLFKEYAYLAETSKALESVIRAGLQKLGTPYKWGATRLITDKGVVNPFFTGNSFDCSSFVQYCYYKGAGIKLGNYTGSQADYTVGKTITDYNDLKRGDFYFTGKDGVISHVVIYLGGGYLLQTYSADGGPVSVTQEERWKKNFISGRRPDLTVVVQYR